MELEDGAKSSLVSIITAKVHSSILKSASKSRRGEGGGRCNKAYSPLLSNNWPSNEESLIRNPRSMRPSSSALGAPVNLVQSASQPVSQSTSSLDTLPPHPKKKKTHPTSFLPSNPDKYPISKIILSTGNPVNTLLITTVILFNLPS